MEIAVNCSLFSGLNPKIIRNNRRISASIPSLTCRRTKSSHQIMYSALALSRRESNKYIPAICAVLSGTEDIGVSSSQFEDIPITVTTSGTSVAGELKLNVEVSGAKTRAIFDEVFDKMVTAAQPIPGFRRVKGGKTPNIPRDILLEVLGPSKVYKQVIKKVINSAIAEYVEKQGLKVRKDLRVEQSFEDLEVAFEPGEDFSFDAVIHLP
ncbi:PREDICTED: trigger factor-like [Prunus mume]|uniref:Trigger factor-like n=1 Tax=Prunus mume TaxID=102107 RepID=A0ABM0NC15_PRUMU|nr:PREDICTED: trigger factor-like [Prunus mume]